MNNKASDFSIYSAQENNPFQIDVNDVIRYNNAQIKKAKRNLIKAHKRGDKETVVNIARKISLYSYTIELAINSLTYCYAGNGGGAGNSLYNAYRVNSKDNT